MANPLSQPSQAEVQTLINALNNGQLAQTEQLAKSLISKHPDTFILHHVLSLALDGQQKYAEAVASYRNALKLQPNTPDLLFNLGIALSNLNRFDEAETAYRQAIRLNPNFFEAYGNLGTVLQRQGKLGEAITCYQHGLKINPQDARGYFNLGTALRDEGLLDDAVRNYQVALTLNPNHPGANYNMGEFLYLAQRFDEAVAYFERSQLDDWQARSMYCLYKAERFDDFKTNLDEIVRTTRHTAPFMATLATHYAINFGVEDPYNFCKNGFDFVYQNSIPELAEPNSPLLRQLLHDIEHTDIAERVQGMLYNGKQSAGNLFKRPEPSFRRLGELVKQEFVNYKNRFADADCELIRSFPKELEFTSSWYVRIRRGGYVDRHIHEVGWISGAVYLALPTDKKDPTEGCFEYGTHGDNYPKKHDNFPVGIATPKVGDIVLFPSSLFHRTIPFSSDEIRICIAFDLKPDGDIFIRSNY